MAISTNRSILSLGPRAQHIPTLDSADERTRDLQSLATWMDSAFEIPGLGIRFGLDSLLGLLPGLGDTVTSFVSLYLVAAASRFGMSRVTLLRMTMNVAIDWLLGSIPLFGDLFDVYWKANQMNMALLRRHLATEPSMRRRARSADWAFVGVLAVVFSLLVCGSVVTAMFVFHGIGQLLGLGA
jgi:hypothetical protein